MRALAFAILCVIALGFGAPAFAQNNRATINGSVVITVGNTFQQILAAANRWSLTIQNNNASDSCWIELGSTQSITTGHSILLLAGQAYTRYYPYIPSDAIQGTCATSSDTLYVDTQ